MSALNLRVDELLLDAENPRFVHGSSQRDVLQKILDDQKEKLLGLAESISADGMNPVERLLVLRDTKQTGKFVVLEGNRRLAALTILENPSILSSLELAAPLRRRFEEVAAEFDVTKVEPIACFEVQQRETGTPWIMLRHTGENGGRGVVSWSGLAASRFRGREPALQALDFVLAHGGLDERQRKLVGDNNFPITTLDRLLSARDVRARLGFDVKNRSVVSELAADELIKPLKRIVIDLAEKRINVSQLKNKTQQTAYVDGFDAASKPNLGKRTHMRPLGDIAASEFKKRAMPAKRTTSQPPERKASVPRGLKLNLSGKPASIFQELRTLKLDEAPNAIAVLLRVFLELSLDHYLSRHKIPLRVRDAKSGHEYDKKLKQKLEEVIAHLIAAGASKRDFAGVTRAISIKHSPLNIDLLNDYVHNLFVVPKRADLMAAWDEAQPLFERIWP